MEALTTALTNATSILTSTVTAVTGNAILMVPIGLGLLAGGARFIKSWL